MMRTVRHNTGKQFLRLANVDAALLVASRRWVYCKAWEASLAAAKPRRRWGRIVLILAMVAAIIAAGIPLAAARECFGLNRAQKVWGTSALSYRVVDGRRCYFPRSQGRVARSEFKLPGAKGDQGLARLRTHANQRGADKIDDASSSAGKPITFRERWP